MSAGPDYIITAEIQLRDSTGAGAAGVGRGLRGVEGEGHRVAGSIGGAFAKAFALIGGAAGVGLAMRGIISLNSALQTTQNGLATLFTATAGLPLVQSIGLARKELVALKADAAAGVGELADYTQAYQMLLSPGLGAGKSLAQIRDLGKSALAAGAALRGGEGLKLAPMDLQQAMTAGAGERTTPIVMAALRAAGITAAKFNAESASARFDDLMAGFGKFAPGIALMGKSWDAQFSTLQDNIKDIIRTVTSPLFDRWTADLTKVNEWLAKNKEQMATIATEWGGKLVKMWDVLIARAGTYAAILAAASLAPMGGLGGTVGAGASAVGGAFRAGYAAPGVGATLGYRIGGGLAGGAGALGGALAPIGAALSAAAGPLLLVGVALVAVMNAFKNGGPSISFMERALVHVKDAIGKAATSLDYLTAQGGAVDGIGQALIGLFGAILEVVGPLVQVLASVAVGFGLVMNILLDVGKMIGYMLKGDWAKVARISVGARASDAGDALSKIWAATPPDGKKKGADGEGGAIDPKDLKVPKSVTNIGTVNIYPKVELNADPDRLIAAMGEAMDKLRVYSRSGARLPALGM